MAKTTVNFSTQKIWDIDATTAADGVAPDVPLSGEIHPDIIRYKGWWYVTLKEAGLERMRLIRSPDGEKWESVRLFRWGADGTNFEGRFSITPYGSLMITSYIRGRKLPGVKLDREDQRVNPGGAWIYSITWLSDDGVDWGQPFVCPSAFAGNSAVTRFTTTWFRGVGYSIAHPVGHLYRTFDGKSWAIATPDVWSTFSPPEVPKSILGAFDRNDWQQSPGMAPRRPHETALAFDPVDGSAFAISRTHPFFAIIGRASAPHYNDWQWETASVDWEDNGTRLPAAEKLGVQMGGPCMHYLSNGQLLLACRADASTPDKPAGRVTLFFVERETATLRKWCALDGFSNYPGFYEYEGKLWLVCGKQQYEPLAIYLLKIPI